MQLHEARLCLDCEELHTLDHCPRCASEAFAFVTRWIPAKERPARPRRPVPPTPSHRARWVTGATGVAAFAAFRWWRQAAAKRVSADADANRRDR